MKKDDCQRTQETIQFLQLLQLLDFLFCIECIFHFPWKLAFFGKFWRDTSTSLLHNKTCFYTAQLTLPTAEILSGKNPRAFLFCGVLIKSFKKNILYIWKKSWEPFGSYLLNSTANPANFHPNWVGLDVLFSRQLLNCSKIFFLFDILKLI